MRSLDYRLQITDCRSQDAERKRRMSFCLNGLRVERCASAFSLAFVLAILSAFVFANVAFGWDNLDYGLPGTNGIVVLDQDGYACGYDTNRKQAAWVSYRLTAEEAAPGVRVARTDCFRADERLGKDSVTPEDYRGSGYDKGHLAPAGDMMWSESAMRDSFLMSNMSPQRPAFNRGVWRELEYWVRECARTNRSVFVVTGPVFGGSTNKIGRCGVVVPNGYYKVVLVEGSNVTASARQQLSVTNRVVLGFLLPNRGSTNRVESFRVPLSAVEEATGLRFFEKARGF